jgi:hypothetical protein
VSVVQQTAGPSAGVTATPTVAAPGTVDVSLTVGAGAPERDVTGFVLLSRGSDVRRVPYWFRVEAPKLGTETAVTIARAGVYRGNTSRGVSRVSSYRYPEAAPSGTLPTRLNGPEQVFRFRLSRPVANFGAVVLSQAPGVHVQPRLVLAGDENRLVGYTGYPVNLNPYQNYGAVEPVVGAVLPAAGDYDLVFDTESEASSGAFTFRFWVDDTTPPAIRLVGRSGRTLHVRVTDASSGVDPRSLTASVDGHAASVRWRGDGRADVVAPLVRHGRNTLAFTASDYQEAKNMEDVGPVLPNTRTLRTSFRVP